MTPRRSPNRRQPPLSLQVPDVSGFTLLFGGASALFAKLK
jgi:hypothetical protein